MTRYYTEEEANRIIAYNNPVKFFLYGVLGGALIGGILGILYAPKKGSETRELIRDKTEDTMQFVRDRAEDVRDKAAVIAEDVRIKAAETRKRAEQELAPLREKI